MSSFSAKANKTIAVLSCVMLLASCSATYEYHGYAPSDAELENVIVGADTRETVEEIIGKPTTTGALKDGNWYYVSSKVRNYTYHAPKEVKRELVAVSFDKNDVVSNIERFGLKDGRIITLNRRVTSEAVKGPSVLSQVISNIGNVDLGQVINGG